MNEIRNELLLLKDLVKAKEEDKEFQLEWLLDRFEYDIKDQLKEVESKKKELADNLKTLEYVRKELGIKGE